MIQAEAGNTADAIAKFEESPKVPEKKAVWRFGLVWVVWSSYKAKAYDKVVDAWKGLQIEDYSDLYESSQPGCG